MASSSTPAQAEAVPDGTTDFKPLRSKGYDMRKPHIADTPITAKNWYKHVNWLNVTLILFVPITGLIASYWVPLQLKTALFAIFYYYHTGLGITAGMIEGFQSHRTCLSQGMTDITI